MRIEEAKEYLNLLDQTRKDPKILFYALFRGKDKIDRTDLINLYYRINDINGLNVSDWIKKCMEDFFDNPAISIVIDGLTDINLYTRGINLSEDEGGLQSRNHICTIDLYDSSFCFDDSDLEGYEKLASRFIEKPSNEPFPRDEYWKKIHNHIKMSAKDRLQLIYISYKRKKTLFTFMRDAAFWITVKKSKVQKVYEKREEEYRNHIKWNLDYYEKDLLKQKRCRLGLDAYRKRIASIKNEIKEKLTQSDYVEKSS